MQSLAEKPGNHASDAFGRPQPGGETTDYPPTIDFPRGAKASLKGLAGRGRRRWWAIGGGCAIAVPLLFGLFHPRPRPMPKMRQAEGLAIGSTLAWQDANSAASSILALKAGTGSNAPQSAARVASSTAPPPSMIARTVSLIIQVIDFAGSRAALDAILARYQGYAAQLNINTPENAARTFGASLRIPAPALPGALADLRKLGRVQSESQTGEEVTEQHTDLVARLRNARETEQRLQAILHNRTGKVEEVLAVEEQISNTRGEIERMEAEQKALEHRVDFATVQLQMAEVFQAQLNPPSTSVGTRVNNALVAGLGSAGESILGILLFLEEYGPVLLVWFVVLGTPAWLVWRRYRNAHAGV
jgi:Domain of unknown function (DUF4349)